MSESSAEPTGIDDEQLPDDLVPGDDNPLAEPLADGESAGELLEEGKSATESAEASDDADPAAETDSTP